ncbi:MAG TPA: hypothetical protein VFA65_20455 [Bryobacteraceae bacterium]|nr:hypothetical protein [Bryobacteraceae bacterium]
MTDPQDVDAEQILKDATAIYKRQGEGVVLTLVGAMNNQFVLIFNIESLSKKDPASRDHIINDVAKKLLLIKGVARVCYEIFPDKSGAH